MAERTLRGARLGGQSFEDERGIEFAARQQVGYRCPQGHEFEITMSVEADIPAVWECPRCGEEALSTAGIEREVKAEKPVRTHWDMLLERRSEKELEDILKERLELLRGGEIGPAHLHRANAEEAQGLGLSLTAYALLSSTTSPRITGPSGPGPGRRASPPPEKPAFPARRPSGPSTTRRRATPVSARRNSGLVTGRIISTPKASVTKPGRQHQRAADQDQRAVGELLGRHPAAVERLAQRPPGPRALVPDQPGAEDAVEDQQQDRPPRPDRLADLDDHVDLDQRYDDEQVSSSQPSRRATPAPRPVGPPQRPAHLVAALAQPPAGDPAQRLGGDRAAHLRVAAHPLDELDRHLAHGQPGAQAAGDQVGLEDVAGGLDRARSIFSSALRRKTRKPAVASRTRCRAAAARRGCRRARAPRGASASSPPSRRGPSGTRSPGRRRASASSSRCSCSGWCDPSASISPTTS